MIAHAFAANDTAADPVAAARVAQEAREAAYRASHVWQGDLWQQGRDLADVAKAVRAALKDAGLVARVTISRYSMGQTLSVRITPPAGMVLLSVQRIRQDMGLAPREPIACWRSRAAMDLLAHVEAMVARYNRSWSDKDQAFHADIDFAGPESAAQREAIETALRGAYAQGGQ